MPLVLCQNDPVIRKSIEDMSDQCLPAACIRFVLDGAPNWIVGKNVLSDSTYEYMRQYITDNTTEVEYTPPVEEL